MNGLIPLHTSKQPDFPVSHRELAEFLQILPKTIVNYLTGKTGRLGFLLYKDYTLEIVSGNVENSFHAPEDLFDTKTDTKNYWLTINTAKKISMMANSERGNQARDYFLKCEEIAQNKQLVENYQIPKSYKEALLALVSEIEEKEKLEAENKILAPKAESYDKFMNADGCFSVDVVAKIIGTDKKPCGSVRLFNFLRQNMYLNSKNEPYQKYRELGWFRIIPKTWSKKETGEEKVYSQTFVTPKGVEVIRKLWMEA